MMVEDNITEKWFEKHREGTRKTLGVPCPNPECWRNTRAKFKCQYCGYTFTTEEVIKRGELQKQIYDNQKQQRA